jgi:hypothetical protein
VQWSEAEIMRVATGASANELKGES